MALPLNRGQLYFLLQLLLLGLLVGLACWPLNLVDHVQDLLLQQLPNFAGGAWTLQGLAIAATAAPMDFSGGGGAGHSGGSGRACQQC